MCALFLCLSLSVSFPARQRRCSELGVLASWPFQAPQKTLPHWATPQTLPSAPQPHTAPLCRLPSVTPSPVLWFLRLTDPSHTQPSFFWVFSSLMLGQGQGDIVTPVPTHLGLLEAEGWSGARGLRGDWLGWRCSHQRPGNRPPQA